MNKWFSWYKKFIGEKYEIKIDFSEDNVIDYVVRNKIFVGYLSGRWFIKDDMLSIEVYDTDGKGIYITEDCIIKLNWCNGKVKKDKI